MKHPRHTYGGFVLAISERGMTSEDDEGVLWYKGRICVPNVKELKDKILCEAHESAYSIHSRGNKM
jgi:hypothetical protein